MYQIIPHRWQCAHINKSEFNFNCRIFLDIHKNLPDSIVFSERSGELWFSTIVVRRQYLLTYLNDSVCVVLKIFQDSLQLSLVWNAAVTAEHEKWVFTILINFLELLLGQNPLTASHTSHAFCYLKSRTNVTNFKSFLEFSNICRGIVPSWPFRSTT